MRPEVLMQGRCLATIAAAAGSEGLPAAQATWLLDKDILSITSPVIGALALPVAEISGFTFDDTVLALCVNGRRLILSKLGAGGPTLYDALERAWPLLRAQALRLQGRGEPHIYPCSFAQEGAAVPGRVVVYDDLLLVYGCGSDLSPIFLPLVQCVMSDEANYLVTIRTWEDASYAFSKLGPKTSEFARRVTNARAALTSEASAYIRGCFPSLDAFAQMSLSAQWLPGRLLSLEQLAMLVPEAPGALDALVAQLPRKRESGALRKGAAPSDIFFALVAALPEAQGGEEEQPSGDAAAPEEDEAVQPAAPMLPATLWLAARRGDDVVLESLSEGDRATYVFNDAEKVLPLLSMLLCAPQFSREALYVPVEKLVGDRAVLAVAARELAFLKELRKSLKARIIHRSFAQWSKDLGF
jgi:hypothetical protein